MSDRACYNDHIDVVNLLISYGASVSARTKMGWEPLHSACHWNHANCISRLFAAGANVNARSTGGKFNEVVETQKYFVQFVKVVLFIFRTNSSAYCNFY